MGLFDLFKKKSPTHEEKVALAYKCYKPEMVSMVFPGGTKQVSNVIVSLAKIYGVSLEPLTAKEYYDILTAYSDVLIRLTITNSSDKHIVGSLQVKHKNYIKNAETAEKVFAFCKLNVVEAHIVFVATVERIVGGSPALFPFPAVEGVAVLVVVAYDGEQAHA